MTWQSALMIDGKFLRLYTYVIPKLWGLDFFQNPPGGGAIQPLGGFTPFRQFSKKKANKLSSLNYHKGIEFRRN